MKNIPGHISPTYSDSAKEDALFHYTTAEGLKGIFKTRSMWSTAYYCANDESELEAGKGILQPLFYKEATTLLENRDKRAEILLERGSDIREIANKYENQLRSIAFSKVCAYITCFCKASSEEDFRHGRLSQWRGYGSDGGYAIQLSRAKLKAAIETARSSGKLGYDLRDVYYASDNELKREVLTHEESFIRSFHEFLGEMTRPLEEMFGRKSIKSPLPSLLDGPLETLLDYLIHSKNLHFSEENECRLSIIQPTEHCSSCLPIKFFNRNGLLVPYTDTSDGTLDIMDCIEWILVGPGPRLDARMKSVSQLIKQSDKDIKVRPSHIPFTRL